MRDGTGLGLGKGNRGWVTGVKGCLTRWEANSNDDLGAWTYKRSSRWQAQGPCGAQSSLQEIGEE